MTEVGEGGNIGNAGVDLGMALLTEIGHCWEMSIEMIAAVCLSLINLEIV